MKVLVLGATGMAGHIVTLYLYEKGYNVETFSRKPTNFCNCKNFIEDATNFKKLQKIVEEGNYDAVINCIGILNEDAEKNKSNAVLINSFLPHFLSEITSNSNTKIIHLSTDCVFSGKKGNYIETDLKDSTEFYGRTKALGEIDNKKDLTFRTSIVGPDMKYNGIGLFNWFMKQKSPINGFTKVFWSGVTTIVLAKAIEKAINSNLSGVYHLTNNQKISKFELLMLFNKYFRNNEIEINEHDKIRLDKSLLNTRKDFSFDIPSYSEMVKEMKDWVISHKELYPHYFQ